MKILITNIVTLNGGDFAILESMIEVLKQTYGQDTQIIVYDLHADIASKYYPEINFRTLLYIQYRRSLFQNVPMLNRLMKLVSPINRLRYAAWLYSKGQKSVACLLLNSEERLDFQNYLSADLIISTGGTYLVENYSLTERIFDYNFTLALNKPLVFFTQSLGPFIKPENKLQLKRIFNKASLILLRDKASLNNLIEIDVDVAKAKICADVVFSDTSSVILEEAKSKTLRNPLKIGISVRYWKFFKGRSTEEGQRKYFNSIAAICEYLTLKLGGEVLFVSTCQAIKEYHVDDSKAAQEIFNLLSDETKLKVTVDSDFHTPNELKAILKSLDVVISTRMHGAIQALNVGIPVLPIAYEFKTKELFKKLIDEELILDIDTLEEDKAVIVFDKFLTSLPEFRVSLFEKVLEEHISSLKPVHYLKEMVV